VRIEPQPDGVRLHTDQGIHAAGQVIVAAGAWSSALLAPFGVRVPIVPARGYHRMYPTQSGVVQRPTLWAERYMVVSPMVGGIRMTSLKQITALGSTPDFELIRRRDVDARRLFPALSTSEASEWAGYRPCTPDSLPILDRVDEHVTLASGHGHLGITQGPVSGQLIAQRLCGETPSLPMAPYRLARFTD
jgi:D-amino-acid dehydrogenase